MAYILIGGGWLIVVGRPWPVRIATFPSLLGWLQVSLLGMLWQYLRSPKRLRAILHPQRVGGAIVMILTVVPLQITFQALKQSIGPVVGFRADVFLHDLDVLVHGQMAWRAYDVFLSNWMVVRSIDVLYSGWLVLLGGFLMWSAWSANRVLRAQALVAFLLMSILAGTLFATFAASAGPCYYQYIVGMPDPYAPLFERLDLLSIGHDQLWARRTQAMLWTTYTSGSWGAFAGISAMPSMHVGLATLFAIIAWHGTRWLGALLTLFAVVVQVGSVILGWHYAVDGYVGAALAFGVWHLASLLAARFPLRSSYS
jgi:hypothetical protein